MYRNEDLPDMEPILRSTSSNMILILDIDETLVHTITDIKPWNNLNIYNDPKKMDIRDRIYTLDILTDRDKSMSTFYWGIKRPYLKQFLKFCFSYFKLVIPFSAGTYEYVHTICPDIFTGSYEPHYILTRNNCVPDGDKFTKPFWKLLQDIPEIKDYVDFDLDENGKVLGYKNIVIIDDRPVSFYQDPKNGILIPAYEPNPTVEGIKAEDNALLKIMQFFNNLDTTNNIDIRKINKELIFNSISPRHVEK